MQAHFEGGGIGGGGQQRAGRGGVLQPAHQLGHRYGQIECQAGFEQQLQVVMEAGRAPGFANYLASFQKAITVFNQQRHFDNDQPPTRILVLGSNEFVWLPFLLAEWLEQNINIDNADPVINQQTIKFSALTRSPIALGGGISTMLSFNDNYGLGMTNFAYNVDPNQWDLIVLCVETSTDSVDPMWHSLDNVLIVSPT